jgi:hypothetical protein
MTATGWIVVLGPVGAYALLWFLCWKAMTKGPQKWPDTRSAPRLEPSSISGSARSTQQPAHGLVGVNRIGNVRELALHY